MPFIMEGGGSLHDQWESSEVSGPIVSTNRFDRRFVFFEDGAGSEDLAMRQACV